MNKKGFAISIILYSIVFLLITILYMILSITKTRYNVTSSLRDEIIDGLNINNVLYDVVATLGDDSSVEYVQKYNTSNGAPMDTPTGTGDKDVYYYTSATTANLAGQNGNVIFGNFCWQIVRTTADGGVRLIYNGPKTNDDRCPSAVAERPSTISFVGGDSGSTTNISGSKIYGESFEIFDDNGTKKFRLLHTNAYSWSDSTYEDILGKFLCGTSSSPTGSGDTCDVMYFVSAYYDNAKAIISKYTLGAPDHYSSIGKSTFNPSSSSPAFVGYMFNDIYLRQSKTMTSARNILVHEKVSSKYYYGDTATWNSSTNKYDVTINGNAPTTSTAWNDIRSNVAGKYTCKNTTDTSCATVYYVVANSTDSYMNAVDLSNNENINTKSVTLTYSARYSESGNNYTLYSPDTVTVLLKDWYDKIKNNDILLNYRFASSDFTSTTCTKLYNLGTTEYSINYVTSDNSYIYGWDAGYSNGNYSLAVNTGWAYHKTWEWYGNIYLKAYTHYTCFKGNTDDCGSSIYYVYHIADTAARYIILKGGDTIATAVDKMLNVSNSNSSTINKYNSAEKAVIDSWYETNLLELSDYLDMDSVYCNDRSVKSLGTFANIPENGPTDLKFTYYDKPTDANAKLTCTNKTDRFSVNNSLARLKYPVGLLTEPERALMQQNYAKTGKSYRLGTPYVFDDGSVMRIVGGGGDSTGNYSSGYYYTTGTYGTRPVITLKQGIKVRGEGTYNAPYVVQLD